MQELIVKVAEVLKKGQSFYRKDTVFREGRQVPKTIMTYFNQLPSPIFFIGRHAGIYRVSKDVPSNARKNLLWKKVVEVLKKGQGLYRKDAESGRGQILETILTYFNKFPFVRQLKKNLYFRSLFPGISMYFPVLQLPQKHIQIKITNYYFYLLNSTHTINCISFARSSCAHIRTRIVPFGAVRSLSIYMNDGEAIRIPFTTAWLFNHR